MRTAIHIKLPLLRPALLLCAIFSVIGSFQLFAEPRIFYDIAPQVIGKSYTPNLYVYNLAFADQRLNYAAALSFLLGAPELVEGSGTRQTVAIGLQLVVTLFGLAALALAGVGFTIRRRSAR